jgi:hypothetical protein
MNSSSNTVTAELGFRLVLPQKTTFVPLLASLYYAATDPYAVRIAFHVGLGKPVEWTFARDLLAKGAEEAVGLSDVKIWPEAESKSGFPGRVLNLELSSPSGQALFEVPAKDMADFLQRTYRIVPEGAEASHLDVDAGLKNLLNGAP